jgi:hypothetical protein
VITDNLGSHKGKAARRLLRGVGAKLFFLPPTSTRSSRPSPRPRSYSAKLRNAP